MATEVIARYSTSVLNVQQPIATFKFHDIVEKRIMSIEFWISILRLKFLVGLQHICRWVLLTRSLKQYIYILKIMMGEREIDSQYVPMKLENVTKKKKNRRLQKFATANYQASKRSEFTLLQKLD